MSNWVGGLPPEPKGKEEKKAKKSPKPASPSDGGQPKTFYGGAIPPVPPTLPKYKKDKIPPPKVKITGAGPPVSKHASAEPKAPPPSPPTPLPPPPPPPLSPVSDPTPQSDSPPPLPTRLPSVFDKKPKKKRKKKKKKKKPPPPPPPPPKPIDRCDDDVYREQGEDSDLGQVPSIFLICHIPATRQGQGLEDDYGGYEAKEDRSGHASPRSGEEDDGSEVPPNLPTYMHPDEFSETFGKMIDARNIAELGPHGWHPTANAPYDITDTGDTVTVGPSGWHEPRSE